MRNLVSVLIISQEFELDQVIIPHLDKRHCSNEKTIYFWDDFFEIPAWSPSFSAQNHVRHDDRLTRFVEHRTTTSELLGASPAQTLFYQSHLVPMVFLTKRLRWPTRDMLQIKKLMQIK